MIEINPNLLIPDDEIVFDFIRSSGPGRQNVNKVSSAVQLRWNISTTTVLNPEVKQRLIGLAGEKLTKDGVLILDNGTFHELGFYPQNLSGRSGRGDTCIGTYVAMRLRKSPRNAGVWAAAVTSLKMEKIGPFDRPVSDVEALIHARYDHGSQS